MLLYFYPNIRLLSFLKKSNCIAPTFMNYIKNQLSYLYPFFVLLTLVLLFACGKTENSAGKTASEETITTGPPANVEKEIVNDEKKIIFFGNSLTAGYGVDPEEAFPGVIQKIIDSLDLDYQVVNAGISGETTATGKNRLEWILKQQVDVFVLELGANDGLRGINLDETEKNLQEMIDMVKKTYPQAKIVLAGMQIPPSMGAAYVSRFQRIFPELADQNDIYLIPFLLEGVGGEPTLNLPDLIHPTVEGHKIVAENVWEVLKDIL